ncbi:MAG: hypothetical protein NTW21_41535 [Verrucomicrobia bacterium]|nr:hypothetical protein [Verrucomicrobiota bacterium]
MISKHLFCIAFAACLVIGVSMLSCIAAASAVEVTNLRCEYRENPMGIDALRPRLSWKIEERGQNAGRALANSEKPGEALTGMAVGNSEVRGEKQRAYPAPTDANYKMLVNSLLQAPADATGIKPTLTIGGLTIGRTYRLQIICNVPRNGVAEVAGGKHRLSNGEVKTPALLTATWEASTGTLTKRWIGQAVPGTPVHFSAYALHDLGLATVDGK